MGDKINKFKVVLRHINIVRHITVKNNEPMERSRGFMSAKLQQMQRIASSVVKMKLLNFIFAINMGKARKCLPITVDSRNVRRINSFYHHDAMRTMFCHEVQKIVLLSDLGCLHNNKFFLFTSPF
uniref:AsIV-cont00106-ORF2 n=1 Tax=Apophua simplicipes ichnovirus TaxID=1329648 RepID=S5DT40_9VIRU|nr:AsIV-cont00106-ORF2 [Apophua simplicipes ichnovirus]